MSGNQNKKASAEQPKIKPRRQQINSGSFVVPDWALPALLAFTAILYCKTAFCALTGLDDDFYVTNNADIRGFSFHNIYAIFTTYYAGHYQPLTMLLYMLVYKFFELNPMPYHLLNVLFHLVNIALVFKLAEQLSGQKLIALVVAILFAVHPMNVQTVAWVSELKNVFYAFFYLLALLVYLRYISSGYRLRYYLVVTLLFVAALLSKSAAVTLPVLLVVFDFYKGRKLTAVSIAEKALLILLSLAFGVLAIISQKHAGANTGLMISYGPVNSFFLFTSSVAFYFIWLLAPVQVSSFHYFPELNHGLLPWIYYASLPVVLLVAWLVVRRNAIRKEVWFGVAFFFVAISVMLQIVSVGSALVAEHYTYVAYIGLFYIIGQFIAKYIQADQFRSLTIGVFSVLIILFSIETWTRIDVWKDSRTLFDDLIEKNPNISFGYWVRGNVEKKDGDLKSAFTDYSKAIELDPGFADAYYNRGVINNAFRNLPQAIADYNESIKLEPKQSDAYNNRGWVYYETGNRTAALADYRRALALKPDYAEAFNNLGWAYDQSDELDSAIRNYTKAITVQPGYKKPMYNLAALKARTGDLSGAIEEYNSLINLYPDDNMAYLLRGKAFMARNDLRSACADWQKAKALGSEYADGMLQQYCR